MTDAIPMGNDGVLPNHVTESNGSASLGEVQERQIREFVDGVIRHTRLWQRERYEVRRELLSHFSDGADSGRSPDQLIMDFGDPLVAARLIRKAKIRNRSWGWHIRHRLTQVTAAGVCLLLACVLCVAARFHLAVSTPPNDAVEAMDRANANVPSADRGWPEYREGLLGLDRIAFRWHRDPQANLWTAVPHSPNWPQAVQYLDAHARSIELFVRGSTRPRLGYLYRDPANDARLIQRGGHSAAETYPADVERDEILLPHFQELMYVRTLLDLSALRALENRDLPAFRKFWQAESRLATQILSESEIIVVQGMGQACAYSAMALLRRLAIDYSDLLTDEQLQAWRHDFELTHQGELKSSTVAQIREGSEAFLQTCFTSQADGGRLTPSGFRFLMRRLSQLQPGGAPNWPVLLAEQQAAGATPSGVASEHKGGTAQAVREELTAVRWSATLASRQVLRLEIERLLTLLQAELDQPLAQRPSFAKSGYLQELENLAATSGRSRSYWPLLLILPFRNSDSWPDQGEQTQIMLRQGTLATFGLEQFRRRTGNWPQQLEQLVPAELSRLPVDVFSGRPLIYRIVNGKPLLYSIWNDYDDDGGQPVPKYTTTPGPFDGDFRVSPVD